MYKKLSDIQGFETCTEYLIYDDGKLYNLKKKKFLKPLRDSKGYFYYDIRYKKAKYKCPKIHRLVMLAFSNEAPQPQINHIDGNKANNHIDNLEWCNNDYNRKHAINIGLKNEVNFGIAQYDLDDNLLYIWHTGAEAMKWLGKNSKESSKITRVVRGERKTYCGYKWKQYLDYDFEHPEKYHNQTKPKRKTPPQIAMCDKNGYVLKIFNTTKEAVRYLNKSDKSTSCISAVINGHKKTYLGYKWKRIS